MVSRCEFARRLALEMGAFTLKYYDRPDLLIESKSDGTPVTLADRGAEELARKLIKEAFPEDGILGEEMDDVETHNGWQWILDPIDGTKSFIHGVPFYSNLIGVLKDDQPLIGVIWLPALGRGVWAGKGLGAWEFNGTEAKARQSRVSTTSRIEDALFLVTDVRDFEHVGRRGAYEELERRAKLTRTWGDAYGYYMVATGRADFMADPYFEIWDAAPLLTVLTESGGAFGTWQGEETIVGREGVASNANLKDEVISVLRRYPKQPLK
ncbi:MAG: inositol monophosphatase family protein [Planctomycetia bacterium]|nr:inositol monophosphatase family protein [Planctomycetia bacterium]